MQSLPFSASADFRDVGEVPGPPPLSLIGQIRAAFRFKRDPIGCLRELHSTYGDFVRMPMRGRQCIYFAFGPENNARLHGDTDMFIAKGFAIAGPRGSAQRRLATSLFSLNGDKHKQSRHQLLPAFQKSALAGYRHDLVRVLERHLAEWQPGQAIDLLKEMRRWSWSIAARLLYGLDNSAATDALRENIDAWLVRNASPLVRLVQKDWPLTPYRRLLRHAERLERDILTLFRNRDSAGGSGNDVLSLIRQARSSGGLTFDDEAIVGHVMTLFLAAFETTANTLTWTIFLLAQHPEVQNELLDEIAPLKGDGPRHDQLNCFPLLDAVLKESMRILPAIVASRRISTAECALGPYRLPALARIYFSHYITHHLPELFPEPERFEPRRWHSINPTAAEYLPFGAGARYCIGASFARMIVKTALAMIVPRFRLTVQPGARIDRHVVVSMEPKYGMPMTVDLQDRQFRVNEVRGDIHEMVDLRPVHGQAVPVSLPRQAA